MQLICWRECSCLIQADGSQVPGFTETTLLVAALIYTQIPFSHAVDEALHHPYLASLHDINEEPTCPAPFSFDFEQPSFTEAHIKELIWRESLAFNPDPPY